jgi:thioredoxin 1
MYKNYKTLNDLGNTAAPSTNVEKKEESFVMTVPEITAIEDKETLLRHNKIVVVDIYADWCGPCKTSAPLFAELYEKYKDYCVLVKENVDLKMSPTVQVIPTFQIFFEGKLNSQITGINLKEVEEKIISLIQK